MFSAQSKTIICSGCSSDMFMKKAARWFEMLDCELLHVDPHKKKLCYSLPDKQTHYICK